MNPPPQSPPPYPASTPEKKKGLPPLAWAGIGCGGVLVIAIIAAGFLYGLGKQKWNELQTELATDPRKEAAERVVGLHPDLEKISANDATHEMTIRIQGTGEEMTLSYADLANGDFNITGADGSVTPAGSTDLSMVPVWVPIYPRVNGDPRVIQSETPARTEGLISFVAADTMEDVGNFFETAMSSSSSSSKSSITVGDAERMRRSFRKGKNSLEITGSRSGAGEPLRVQVHYTDDK